MTFHSNANLSLPLAPSALATAVTQSATTFSFVSSLVTGNFAGFFLLFANLQLLSYLPLSAIPLPRDFKEVLLSLSMESMLPNPFQYFITSDAGPTPHEFAVSYGYSTSLFLRNAGKIITIGLLLFGGRSLLLLLVRMSPRRVAALIQVLKSKWQSSSLVLYWVQAYLDLTLLALLQLLSPAFSTPLQALNTLPALLCAALSLLTPMALAYFTMKQWTNIANKKWQSVGKWSVLFQDFLNNKGVRSGLFYLVFLVRRLVYALTLTTLSSFPKLQASIFAAHSATVPLTQALSYLLKYRPYADTVNLYSAIGSEVGVSLVFVLSSSFNYNLKAQEGRVAGVCMAAILGVVGISVAVAVYSSWEAGKRLILAYRKVVKRKQRTERDKPGKGRRRAVWFTT